MTRGPRAAFEAGLAAGEIRLPYCPRCSRHAYPPGTPAEGCPHDPDGYEERVAIGRGRVFAATCARRKPERGGDATILLVDLEEGVRVMAAGIGAPPAVGTPVRLGVDPEGEGAPRLLAEPIAEREA